MREELQRPGERSLADLDDGGPRDLQPGVPSQHHLLVVTVQYNVTIWEFPVEDFLLVVNFPRQDFQLPGLASRLDQQENILSDESVKDQIISGPGPGDLRIIFEVDQGSGLNDGQLFSQGQNIVRISDGEL